MGMTYRDFLRNLMQSLRPLQMDKERQVAIDILASFLKQSPEYVWQHPFDKFPKREQSRFEAWFEPLLERRKQGEPWAYLLGETYFMGYRFEVSPSVLIPRSDSEIIIEEALVAVKKIILQKRAKHDTRGHEPPIFVRLADLGTGSGCLLLTLALELQQAKWAKNVRFAFVGTDLSASALGIAIKNQKRLSPNLDFKWYEGDLFAAFDKGNQPAVFDLIMSNPPYISQVDYLGLEKQVLAYEPQLALTDGADGYQLYKKILSQAPSYIEKNGFLILEHGDDQAGKIKDLAAQTGSWFLMAQRQDYGHHDRVLVWQCDHKE